ncbi:unnamed protein product [Trifolium pratense]|nr:unnamed protein product [Trifolium pratense]
MELKQGNMSVAEYSVKFQSLCRFAPHYNTVEAEHDKCVKFESGLRPEIKHLIGFSEIRDFPTLVNKSRICDEDGRARANHYKMTNEKRSKDGNRWKPYDNKGKKHAENNSDKKDMKCFKCGVWGHKADECRSQGSKCFRCGRFGHKSKDCKNPITCFNCNEEGHISPDCKKPKKSGGKVFALDGGDAGEEPLVEMQLGSWKAR